MRQRILDTSVLISFWRRRGGQPADVEQARAWSGELIDLERTNAIVSPVYTARGPSHEATWDAEDEELLGAARQLLTNRGKPIPADAK
jgi:hypothetical protein